MTEKYLVDFYSKHSRFLNLQEKQIGKCFVICYSRQENCVFLQWGKLSKLSENSIVLPARFIGRETVDFDATRSSMIDVRNKNVKRKNLTSNKNVPFHYLW